MRSSICFGRKLQRFCTHLRTKASCFYQSYFAFNISSCFHFLLFKVNPFWLELAYFTVISLVGYWALSVSKPRTESFRPDNIDIFFTSVSAVTVSSMSTVEMEVFSSTQLILMTVLMLIGGEIFTSMLGLQLARSRLPKKQSHLDRDQDRMNNSVSILSSRHIINHQTELGSMSTCSSSTDIELEVSNTTKSSNVSNINISDENDEENLKYEASRYLGYVVLAYLLVVQVGGSTLVSIYVSLVASARNVVKSKGIEVQTFSVFTVVSTFTNCGFVPTNENMIVFKKNSGLLLLLIPQILLGNTMYPVCIRGLIWVLNNYKITKRAEFSYILNNYQEMGYKHLMSGVHSSLLAATVLSFILVQLIAFCSMEWNSEAMDGLSTYQKLVGSLFQVTNSRHSGESIVDLSTISSAILVLFVVMMYLPPYTAFVPSKYGKINSKTEVDEGTGGRKKSRSSIWECVLMSQLSLLVIFILLICITERQKLKEDPLNFNVLNITLEVISAYGNVGFSTGYSCERRVKEEGWCRDTWTGFAGRWSNKGKFILIIVMFFGRLKKFNTKGGKAWKLA